LVTFTIANFALPFSLLASSNHLSSSLDQPSCTIPKASFVNASIAYKAHKYMKSKVSSAGVCIASS